MPSRYAETLLNKAVRAVSVILLAGVVWAVASAPGHAVQIIDFDGPYDIPNWTIFEPTGGMVTPSGGPPFDQVVITEPTVAAATSMTIASAGPGTFSFDWSVTGEDDGARLDIFIGTGSASVTCNDVFCSSVSNVGGVNINFGNGSGRFEFAVDTGDTIGWSALNTGGTSQAKWTITEFSAPAAVPVPPALLLFMSALVTLFGVGRVRRQRASKAA
jgi:hypothetical protein